MVHSPWAGLLVGWSISRLVSWLADGLLFLLFGLFAGRLVDWMVGYMAWIGGCLFSLIGWSQKSEPHDMKPTRIPVRVPGTYL